MSDIAPEDSNPPEVTGVDYKALADTSDFIREHMRIMVAGLKADGFTDREARVIVAGSMATLARSTEDES